MKPADLAAWRDHMGVSRTRAASMLGLSRNGFSQYEDGHSRIPRHIELACAALAFGLPPWAGVPAHPKGWEPPFGGAKRKVRQKATRASPFVFIRTDAGFWRDDRAGYSPSPADAGVYPRDEAQRLIAGLGPEKRAKLIDAPPASVPPKPQRVTCSRCNGRGEIWFGGAPDACPICAGSGKVKVDASQADGS